MILCQIGAKMRLIYNTEPAQGLVTIKPGKYPVVGSNNKTLDVQDNTHGLTIEHVGYHTDKASCWHVLIDKDVLLVWDHDMVSR